MIAGDGPGTTMISGGCIDRVFDIHSGNVSMPVKFVDVTIRQGVVVPQKFSLKEGGAGIRNWGNARVTLSNVMITKNDARGVGGGGILNTGALTLVDVGLRGNTARHGSGLLNAHDGSLAFLQNVQTNKYK